MNSRQTRRISLFALALSLQACGHCNPDPSGGQGNLTEASPSECRVALPKEKTTDETVRVAQRRLMAADTEETRRSSIRETFQEIPDRDIACALVLQVAACLGERSPRDGELAGEALLSLASNACLDGSVSFLVELEAYRVTADRKGRRVAGAYAEARTPDKAAELAARELRSKILSHWLPASFVKVEASVSMPERGVVGDCLKVELSSGSPNVELSSLMQHEKTPPIKLNMNRCYSADDLQGTRLHISAPGSETSVIGFTPGQRMVMSLDPRTATLAVEGIANGRLISTLARSILAEADALFVLPTDATLEALRTEMQERNDEILRSPQIQEDIRRNLGIDYVVNGTMRFTSKN